MRIPPALAAKLTERVLELLPPPPARVLEVGFAGIHATPLRLAGYTVEVLDDGRARARANAVERAGGVIAAPSGHYDAVVAPAGAALTGVDAGHVIRL